MSTIPQVSHAIQTILTTAVETAVTELHATRRPDQTTLSAAQLVQTLVFGWLAHPDAGLEQLAQRAARVGVAVRAQAIDQRLNNATDAVLNHVLRASLDHGIASDPVAIPILQDFRSRTLLRLRRARIFFLLSLFFAPQRKKSDRDDNYNCLQAEILNANKCF